MPRLPSRSASSAAPRRPCVSETVGIPDVKLDEGKVKHTYVRGDKYRLDYIQGAAVGADGSLYLMDIYPQLNVVCFPKLTAPK